MNPGASQKPTTLQRAMAFLAAKDEVLDMKLHGVGHWREFPVSDDELHRIADAVAAAVVLCHE
jgi:hypothetical protein